VTDRAAPKGSKHTAAVTGTLLIAVVWGASFASMKFAMQGGLSVGAMLTCRFLLGSACLGLLLLVLRVPLNRPAVRDGLILGLLLTAIFWLQANGLKTTTTTKSGFITGLYVLFTPMASVLMGHRLKLAHGLGALQAATGILPPSRIIDTLRSVFKDKPSVLPVNEAAFAAGRSAVEAGRT